MLKIWKDTIDKNLYKQIIKEGRNLNIIYFIAFIFLSILLFYLTSNYYLALFLFLILFLLYGRIEKSLIDFRYTNKIWLKYGGNLSYFDVILHQPLTTPGNLKLIFNHHEIKLISESKEISSLEYQQELFHELKKNNITINENNEVIDRSQLQKINTILNENYPINNAYTYIIPLLKPVPYVHPLDSFFSRTNSVLNKHTYEKVIVILKRKYWENSHGYKTELEINGVYFEGISTHPYYFHNIGQINSKIPIFIEKYSLKDWFDPLTDFDLIKFKKIIFVEGPSDVAIFNSFASKLGINLEEEKICFKSLDGVNNLKFLAIKSFLESFIEMNIQIEFIIDGDQAVLPKIRTQIEKIGELAKITFLKMKEIENYFLKPPILREFIKWKILRRDNGKSNQKFPNEFKISNVAIETAKENLFYIFKDNILRKTLGTNFPNRDRLIKINEKENLKKQLILSIEDTKKEWNSRLNKLEDVFSLEEIGLKQIEERIEEEFDFSNIPGKIFLDEFCKKFKFRFKKTTEEYKILTESTRIEQIDEEIKEIFKIIMKFD